MPSKSAGPQFNTKDSITIDFNWLCGRLWNETNEQLNETNEQLNETNEQLNFKELLSTSDKKWVLIT